MTSSSSSAMPMAESSRKSTLVPMPTKKKMHHFDNMRDGPVKEFVTKTLLLGVDNLRRQFRSVKSFKPPNSKATRFHANTDKNRYHDIPCLDSTRVILKCDGRPSADDYIHANTVVGSCGRPFVCSQAPTLTTLIDFWTMVWQEKCGVILMLCKLVEKDEDKCDAYWPAELNGKMKFGKLSVVKTAEHERYVSKGSHLKVSTLVVTMSGSPPRTVTHMLWSDWPDRGAPSDPRQLIKIRTHVIDAMTAAGSAGLVPSDFGCPLTLIKMSIIDGEDKQVALDVEQIVNKVRSQRMNSVQSEVQCVFLHVVLIDYIMRRQLIDPSSVPGLTKFNGDYQLMILPKTKAKSTNSKTPNTV